MGGVMTRPDGLPAAAEYLRRFVGEAHAAGFIVSEYGRVGEWPLLVASRPADTPHAPAVMVSAGIHGDEPAGPLAVLSRMTRRGFERSVGWTVFPLLNPTGWNRGTRECAAGIDLNRDYRSASRPEVAAQVARLGRERMRFDWALCLHEDWEATGVYVYELAEAGARSMARRMLEAASAHAPIEPATEIDGMPAHRGIITPSFDDSRELDNWPEALWLMRDYAPRVHTLETPSALPLSARIAACEAALTEGLAALREPAPPEDFMI